MRSSVASLRHDFFKLCSWELRRFLPVLIRLAQDGAQQDGQQRLADVFGPSLAVAKGGEVTEQAYFLAGACYARIMTVGSQVFRRLEQYINDRIESHSLYAMNCSCSARRDSLLTHRAAPRATGGVRLYM